MLIIGKEYTFEAAHHLPNHSGKCRHPHGHTYRVCVELAGLPTEIEGAPDEGMVLDFDVLDGAMDAILSSVDHRDLNEPLRSPGAQIAQPPTVEHIVGFFVHQLSNVFAPNGSWKDSTLGRRIPKLERVRVYEGTKAYAEWRSYHLD